MESKELIPTKAGSRRMFLADGLRVVLLGGFGLLGLFLGNRRRTGSTGNGGCPNDFVCRNCAKFVSCREPLALEERDRFLIFRTCK